MRLRMNGGIGFDKDIKPLFREADQACMAGRGLDLWNWRIVRRNAVSIFNQLSSGDMPPDGAWPTADISKFQDWMEESHPKRRAEDAVMFFTELDANTEFENPPGSGLMDVARVVMGTVLPRWKLYAEAQDPTEVQDALNDLKSVLAQPEMASAVMQIDALLCGLVDKHFRDAGSRILDTDAILDAFEQFGRDRFPEDAMRAQVPGHFDGRFHRMDSTSMWFNWAGQLECAALIAGVDDAAHENRAAMLAGLTLGAPMDFVFREDKKGAKLTSGPLRAPTDPSYSRNSATENRLRNDAARAVSDWERGAERIKVLYRHYEQLI